jgi:AraC family transcriptional regulator of adaptative response/methylated-DNA-[protein]-cysteine methyltransferase
MIVPPDHDHINYCSIAKAIRYLTENQIEQPSLKQLAYVVGMSEFHFQRVFSEWAGVSPKQFLLYLTKENAKKKLREYSVLQSALESGLSGSSRLHDLFITHQSVTPGEYKNWGQGLEISYGIHSCLFGYCLIAITSRGVCKLAFFDELDESNLLISELYQEWNHATFRHDNERTEAYFKRIFLNQSCADKPIHLLLKGTPFKLQVWQALLEIPEGQLASYSQVAGSIKNPSAVRAVASAIANNPIAYLIPCHRVIRNTGVLNDYRWGKERKVAMIAREQSQQEA